MIAGNYLARVERKRHKIQSHNHLYSHQKARPEWRKLLIHQGKKLKHKATVGKIINRVSIEKCPEIVNSRKQFGDWEADTVVSCRGGKSCLAVFVERKSRLYRLAKMKDKSAGEMMAVTIRTLINQGVKTMTYDNGTENANHEFANSILNCKSFFYNAYHCWEKGSIENRNKILRQFFPKGTNFDLISEGEIHKVQNAINARLMKALNWHSPANAPCSVRVISLMCSLFGFSIIYLAIVTKY